jgi:hypothetical protein
MRFRSIRHDSYTGSPEDAFPEPSELPIPPKWLWLPEECEIKDHTSVFSTGPYYIYKNVAGSFIVSPYPGMGVGRLWLNVFLGFGDATAYAKYHGRQDPNYKMGRDEPYEISLDDAQLIVEEHQLAGISVVDYDFDKDDWYANYFVSACWDIPDRN